jgi:signal transduction histidine kinase
VTGLALGLKGLESRLDGETVDPETRNHVRWLQGLAREVGRDIHRASSDLRPTALDDLGLQRALAAHAADWSRRYGITTDIQSLGSPERLPPEVETAIYRAVQEALTNVLKHAGARHVSIVLEHRNGELRVVVEDDGRGFEPDTATRAHGENGPPLGLSGMRERLSLVDGHVRIESAPGAGTTLFMHVPLAERSARHG